MRLTDTKPYFVLVVLLAMLSGCALYGDDVNIDTTRKALAVASAEIRGQTLLTSDLLTRNVISAAQAAEIHRHLQTAQSSLEVGLSALDINGNLTEANSALERFDSALTLVLTLLAPHLEGVP